MSDRNDGPQPGMRQVFEGTDGLYLESTPGGGARHHDDLPASVGDAERRAQQRPDPPTDANGQEPAYAVLMPNGSIALTLAPGPGAWATAHERAGMVGGLIVALPVLVDLRRPGGEGG